MRGSALTLGYVTTALQKKQSEREAHLSKEQGRRHTEHRERLVGEQQELDQSWRGCI